MSPSLKVEEREYLNIYLRADNGRRLYKRQVDDMLTYMGDLGGLLDVLLVLGWAGTALFGSKLFRASLIGQAYHVQSYNKDFTQYY